MSKTGKRVATAIIIASVVVMLADVLSQSYREMYQATEITPGDIAFMLQEDKSEDSRLTAYQKDRGQAAKYQGVYVYFNGVVDEVSEGGGIYYSDEATREIGIQIVLYGATHKVLRVLDKGDRIYGWGKLKMRYPDAYPLVRIDIIELGR